LKSMINVRVRFTLIICVASLHQVSSAAAEPTRPSDLPKVFIDGTTFGWTALEEADFVAVNGEKTTWKWKDGILHCSGKPTGVLRIRKQYTNFEIVFQWKHLESGGNSGLFAWVPEFAVTGLKPGRLPPCGIEVQILDHGYIEKNEKATGKKAINFTTNGDIFPYGSAKMTPHPPVSPNGVRSFPRKKLSRGFGEWNHYYIRGVNAEIRLWVNGEEVTSCENCEPKTGYICLESEGSPIEFKELRIRQLP
jgi:3-keto-disaccharide hydrolase